MIGIGADNAAQPETIANTVPSSSIETGSEGQMGSAFSDMLIAAFIASGVSAL